MQGMDGGCIIWRPAYPGVDINFVIPGNTRSENFLIFSTAGVDLFSGIITSPKEIKVKLVG